MRRRAGGVVRWVVVSVVCAVVVGAGGYGAYAVLRPVVNVTEVVEGPVVQAVYATGTVEPVREYPVRASVGGIVTQLKVDKGSSVSADEAVAFIDDPTLKFEVDQAKAELDEKVKLADEKTSPALLELNAKIEASRQMLDLADRERKRMEALVGGGATTASDVDRAWDRYRSMEMQLNSFVAERDAKKIELQRMVEVAKAALESARAEYDKQSARSPIAGVVLDRPVSPGTRVAINDHLMQVADVRQENLLMRAQVDEEDIAQVSVGQEVKMTLYAFAGRVFEGKVERIYDKADPDRRTFEVDVRPVGVKERLAAGMTGELAFVVATKDQATVVPSQAVQGGKVWVVRGGRLARVAVTVGLRSVERVEIVSGVNRGDRVVLSPVEDGDEGRAVREKYVDPKTAGDANKKAAKQDDFKGFRG